jgi:hypothetical protein
MAVYVATDGAAVPKLTIQQDIVTGFLRPDRHCLTSGGLTDGAR